MIRMLPRVLSLLCLAVGALGWINDYDQPVHFQCPDGQFLSKIDSQHDNGHEDRVWDFGCSRLPVEGTPENCQWTNYINEFDQPLTFQCPNDGFITGTESVHDNRKEDRRFKFQCCEIQGTVTHACYFTNWQNEFDGLLGYTVPSNKILRGVDSYHDNGKEDRRFKFEVCDIDFQD